MNIREYKALLGEYKLELEGHPEYYSLNHLTANDNGMTNDRFHELAKVYRGDVEVRDLYQKIFDILEMRIMEDINSEKIGAGLGQKMLQNFHKWDSKDEVVEEDKYAKMSDGEIIKRMEELGWVRR